MKDLSGHIKAVVTEMDSVPCVLLPTIVASSFDTARLCEYSNFLSEGREISIKTLIHAERLVRKSDVLNLQFTSGEFDLSSDAYEEALTGTGTTGAPKAAMLTHR